MDRWIKGRRNNIGLRGFSHFFDRNKKRRSVGRSDFLVGREHMRMLQSNSLIFLSCC